MYNTVSNECENLLENADFFEMLPTHEEHLKLRSDCDFMNFKARYLEMHNVPVQIVAMQAYELMFETLFKQDFLKLQHYKTLMDRENHLCASTPSSTLVRFFAFKWLYITKLSMFNKKWNAILCQVCMALVAIQYRYDMVHNDMHGQNIMMEKTQKPFLNYKVNDTYYKVPTYGYVVKLIDMGRTTFQIKKTMYMGDVFRTSGEAGEQYSYIHDYENASTDPEKRKDLLLPNPCFDLTRLACSLLDEFYGGAEFYENETFDEPFAQVDTTHFLYASYKENMFRPPTTSSLFNVLCEWITDAEMQPVNRFENFDLYKQIARRMRRSLPIYQLTRPHFNVYACEYDNSVTYYDLTSKKEFTDGVDKSLDRPVYDSDNDLLSLSRVNTTHMTESLKSESSVCSSDSEALEPDMSTFELDSVLQKMIAAIQTTPRTSST
jgi:hypothetical protein